MRINGRHISNAMVERRRMKRCKPFLLAGAAACPAARRIPRWTVSAMILDPVLRFES